MAGIDVPAWLGELVGVQDAVSRRYEDGGGAGPRLGLGDAGHGRPDDPGHLHRRVQVHQVHGHHGLEEVDGLDVHDRERRVVVPDVEEPQGPPEALRRLGGHAGLLGHLGLGQPVPGRNQQRSTTSRSTTSSATARSISSSVQPRSSRRASDPGQRLDPAVVGTAHQAEAGVARTRRPARGGGPAPRWRVPGTGTEMSAGPAADTDRCHRRSPRRHLTLGPRAVLVPVKAFGEAKRRLHQAMTGPERAELARAMADRVLAAAHPLPVGRGVRRRRRGRVGTWPGSPGGVGAGARPERGRGGRRGPPRQAGVDQVTVAHADLPHATDLAEVGEAAGITLVPDRHGNGTNVIALPTDARLPRSPTVPAPSPGIGPRPIASGLPLHVLHRPDLAHDVDEPGDIVPVATPGDPRRSSRRRRPVRATVLGRPAPPRALPVGDLPGPRPGDHRPGRAAAAHWPSGPIPTTSSSGAAPHWPHGRPPAARIHHLVLTDGSKGSWDPRCRSRRLVAERMDECRAAAPVIDGPRPGDPSPPTACFFLGADRRGARQRPDERREVVRDHPPCPTRRRARTRPLAPLPAPPRPSGRRMAHHRLRWWRHATPTSSRARPGAPPAPITAAVGGRPADHVEDAGGFGATKVEALLCHRSQFESTMGIGGAAQQVPSADEARSRFATKVQRQLAEHGASADPRRGGVPPDHDL